MEVDDWTRCHDSAERIDVNRLGLLGQLCLEFLRGKTKHTLILSEGLRSAIYCDQIQFVIFVC